jgi:hypothetical protein
LEHSPSPIDARIAKLGDWRGAVLGRVRAIIKAADPDVVEDVKWRKPSNPAGVPVWEHDGLICTGETYKDKVKLTFANGAALKDPAHDVGGGRLVATFTDPDGNVLGLIQDR